MMEVAVWRPELVDGLGHELDGLFEVGLEAGVEPVVRETDFKHDLLCKLGLSRDEVDFTGLILSKKS